MKKTKRQHELSKGIKNTLIRVQGQEHDYEVLTINIARKLHYPSISNPQIYPKYIHGFTRHLNMKLTIQLNNDDIITLIYNGENIGSNDTNYIQINNDEKINFELDENYINNILNMYLQYKGI